MPPIEELFYLQESAINALQRALPNFKKLCKAKWTSSIIKTRLTGLQDAFREFKELDVKINLAATESQKAASPYFVSNLFLRCEDVYQETIDFFANALGELDTPAPSTNSTTPHPISSSRISHLPSINLPSFDGTLSDWETFRDQFQALIHTEISFSVVDKMHFLKSSLTGEALRSLSHLSITEANYNVAWAILLARYDNKRRLIAEHIHSLFNLPSLKTEDLDGLRDLRDTVNVSLQALRNLNRPVDSWPDIVIYIIVSKFDPTTFRIWETKVRELKDYPSYSDLDQFLESRIHILDAIRARSSIPDSGSPPEISRPSRSNRISSHHTSASYSNQQSKNRSNFTQSKSFTRRCVICSNDHAIYHCSKFLAFSVTQRLDEVERRQLCTNCLSSSHFTKQCNSIFRCRTCKLRHHTLLHPSEDNFEASTSLVGESDQRIATSVIASNTVAPVSHLLAPVLLATARARVSVSPQHWVHVRALVDQGSAATLLSENLARALRVQRHRHSLRITGVGGVEAAAQHTATIQIAPAHDLQPIYTVEAIILSSLTCYSPARIQCSTRWKHTNDLPLADPDPFSPDPVELIIGADLYSQILRDGIRTGNKNEPIAQNTVLGWILSGTVQSNNSAPSISTHHLSVRTDLDTLLRRFWELEELPTPSKLTPEELECETHFRSTHSRTVQGRYIVRLPFDSTRPLTLGDSRTRAAYSLLSLERRMSRDPSLETDYKAFMREYEELGHMQQVPLGDQSALHYYIPHHAVFRRSSLTSQIRVVFNASASTTNGKSLNDYLSIGPKLQTDLTAIILRWRQMKFALTADIEKMYRQILIHRHDANYQRILWRSSSIAPIKEYQLQTVTYGTIAAPFLALRVLRQLAEDEGDKFPLAVSVLQSQTYVDDCIFGTNDLEAAIETRDQLISLLAKGGFRLRKWASNASTLLHDLDSGDHGLALSKEFLPDESLHVLGLSWQPGRDVLLFKLLLPADPGKTKSQLLSMIARFFDPIGLLTPIFITAKVFIQRLWALRCGWDDEIPDSVQNDWNQFYSELHDLKQLTVPRWTGFSLNLEAYELHAFADASTTAYAATIYARHILPNGMISTTLLMSKSKVAPLKTISVSRLELCAAHLLARLLQYVTPFLPTQARAVYCWTDSTIVLAWLRQSPSRWKTFVANRVSSIQSLTSTAIWRHVSTSDNPADCASRGISPTKIRQHDLWWSGPEWLRGTETDWPHQELVIDPAPTPEARCISSHQVSSASTPWELQHRFSSWSKLLRVTALLLKFIRSLRHATRHCQNLSISPLMQSASSDLQLAKLHWLKAIQSDVFSNEIGILNNHQPLTSSSSILDLGPYIDSDGLLRVGGRLRHAGINHAKRHPILLRSHHLVDLLIQHHHLLTLHGGSQLTMTSLRHEFWILRARSLVRMVIHQCLPCVRERAIVPHELMRDLPSMRVNRTTRAFIHTGVDYAGPIAIRTAPGRGHKSHKAYIAIFVCMTIKAIHLELVSDYSSTAFLASYHRFVSRRGLPTAMYSDNGTTFQGADKDLRSAYAKAVRDHTFHNTLATNEVRWHFLPPSAPHFGGLWEAGVRSVKHHLRRCIGSHTLTFEEMTTLLCRIEACLNSRPLAPLSDRLDDYLTLTPGHFLIGSSIIASPESCLLNTNEHRLTRWQLLQRTTELFWKTWSADHLQLLQQRPKWRTIQRLARVGQIVLIRNNNAPPSQWELGRISACHTGEDGLKRVVTVKTSKSEFVRPIVKLCFLPVDINEEETSTSAMTDDNYNHDSPLTVTCPR